MKLVSHLEQFLTHHQLHDNAIVLGLSGGIDSVVLLDLLAKSTFKKSRLKVVHIHHGLSNDADQWQTFCAALCDSYNIDFYTEQVEITDLKLGIEGAAREARYSALAKYLNSDSILLTAQHENDQAETLLLALKRGSGVLGLAAMQPISNLAVGRQARPLLSVSQHAIDQYASANNLTWVEDDSNNDIRFDRNFLRHHIIDSLNERWPHFSKSAARSAQLCQEQMTLSDEIAHIDFSECGVENDQISITHLSTLSDVRVNNVLRYWLRKNNVAIPSYKQFSQLVKQLLGAKQDANITVVLGKHQIKRYQSHAYITPTHDDVLSSLIVDNQFSSIVLPAGFGEISFNNESSQIRVKAPTTNQRVTIEFGLNGSIKGWPTEREKRRTLKKLWQEYQVVPWQRSQIPCLCYDGILVAVLGYWIETEYAVSDLESCEVLSINWRQ